MGVVRALIEGGATIALRKGSNGSTALLEGATQGMVAAVRTLIASRADVDAANDRGETPLMLACKRGHPAAVRVLVQASADLTLRDERHRTALMHCCSVSGDAGATSALLQAGARSMINALDAEGDTALLQACGTGNCRVVELLLREGAEPHPNGKNAFAVAQSAKQTAVCELLYPARSFMIKRFPALNTALLFREARQLIRDYGVGSLEKARRHRSGSHAHVA